MRCACTGLGGGAAAAAAIMLTTAAAALIAFTLIKLLEWAEFIGLSVFIAARVRCAVVRREGVVAGCGAAAAVAVIGAVVAVQPGAAIHVSKREGNEGRDRGLRWPEAGGRPAGCSATAVAAWFGGGTGGGWWGPRCARRRPA